MWLQSRLKRHLSETLSLGAETKLGDTEQLLIDENGTQDPSQRGLTRSVLTRSVKLSLASLLALVIAAMIYSNYARDENGERIPLGCYTHPCVMAACSKWCHFTPVPIPVREVEDEATPTAK